MKNNNPDLFPLLNLPRFKIIAQDWAQRYPAIESLTLYCGRGRSTLAAYVMVAKATTTEDPQSPLDFVFEPLSGFKFRIKNLKPCDQRLKSEVLGRYIKKAQLTEDEAEEFRKQVSELNHIRRERIEEEYAQKGAFQKDWSDPFGRQLLKDLAPSSFNVYKDATTFIKWEDWLFRIIEKEEDLLYLEDDIIPDSAFLIFERKEKKPRPSSIHKEQVRKVAQDIINKEPDITKAALSKRQELVGATSKPYKEKTFYGWIKDLVPNSSPGRRPKKATAKNKQSKRCKLRKIVPNK